jgi:hypothetical protein
MVAGSSFFIAQKQGDLVKKTPTMKEGELRFKNWEQFCLRVKQVSAIGYNGIDGDVNDVVPVVNIGDNYEVSVIETTEGYQPYPTWQYSYTSKIGDTVDTILDNLMAQINDDLSIQNKENEPLVIAEVLGNNTLAGAPDAAATAENGSPVVLTSVNPGAGAFVDIDGINYRVKSSDGVTMVLSGPYVGVTGTVTIDEITATAEVGLRLTTKETGDTFHIALKESLVHALVRVVTPFKDGTGYNDHVANLEYEGQIFDGTTTVNAQFKDKWGEQANYRAVNKGYDVVSLSYDASTPSKALPNSHDSQIGHVVLAGPTPAGTVALPYTAATVLGATNVVSVLKTIFVI